MWQIYGIFIYLNGFSVYYKMENFYSLVDIAFDYTATLLQYNLVINITELEVHIECCILPL